MGNFHASWGEGTRHCRQGATVLPHASVRQTLSVRPSHMCLFVRFQVRCWTLGKEGPLLLSQLLVLEIGERLLLVLTGSKVPSLLFLVVRCDIPHQTPPSELVACGTNRSDTRQGKYCIHEGVPWEDLPIPRETNV